LVHEARAREIEPFFGNRFDERDASARARRFDQRFDVGRTGRQTEPAADTLVEDVVGRDVAAGEAALLGVDHPAAFDRA
jgi:hypothetical protein